MTDAPLRPVICIALAVALFTPIMTAHAALSTPLPQNEKQDKKSKKDSADGKVTKQEREYQKIWAYSKNLYDTDAEFKAEVEEGLRRVYRDHGELAYDMNTRDAADELVTRSGDKLKILDTLYDNPLVQSYVNRVGQSVVPKDTKRRYAFKVTLTPVPEARSLSTGTVYVSSGLISAADNEAQLAYVLAHEVAHIEKEHWKEDVLVERGQERYNEKQQKKRNWIGLGTQLGLGMVGMGSMSYGSNYMLNQAVALALPSLLKLAVPNSAASWDQRQEDEADNLALKYIVDRQYDPREVPYFYAKLKELSTGDQRIESGFMASAERLVERQAYFDTTMPTYGSLQTQLFVGAFNFRDMQGGAASLPSTQQASQGPDQGKTLNLNDAEAARKRAEQAITNGPLAAEIRSRIESGQLLAASAEFQSVMAELNRDNGVRAFYYDMFETALKNLERSINIRSNDPLSYFYLGKVIKLTARNRNEKRKALVAFDQAIRLDRRKALPEARLYKALSLIELKDESQNAEIVTNLKEYVALYQRQHGGDLPDNLVVVYDYLQDAGEMEWAALPATNVSTKGIEPIGITQGRVDPVASPIPAPESAPTKPTRPGRKP